MYNKIFDQKNYIISNQNRDKGRPICIIAYHYISLHIITLYQTKIETRGGPYASLHMKYLIKRITLYESKIETKGAHMYHYIMTIRWRGIYAILYVQYICQLSPNLLLVAISEQWKPSWKHIRSGPPKPATAILELW